MFEFVRQRIERPENVNFQNNVGISSGSFLELLDMYLKYLFSIHEEEMYIQKHGLSIGLAVVPVWNNLYLDQLNGY